MASATLVAVVVVEGVFGWLSCLLVYVLLFPVALPRAVLEVTTPGLSTTSYYYFIHCFVVLYCISGEGVVWLWRHASVWVLAAGGGTCFGFL